MVVDDRNTPSILVELCPGCAYREVDDVGDGFCACCRSRRRPLRVETAEHAAHRRALGRASAARWRAAHPGYKRRR